MQRNGGSTSGGGSAGERDCDRGFDGERVPGVPDGSRASVARRAPASKRRRASPSIDEARAALAASKKLYYRIGEVSALTGVKAHVLRYWETEFRWMAPPKSRSKQRLYRKRDIELVWLLKQLLWEQRYTIAGARQRIQELGLDEALARAADAGAVALDGHDLDVRSDDIATNEPATGIEGQSLAPVLAGRPLGDSERGAGQAGFDWLALRGALESMQTELLALRGALLQEA